MSKKCNVIKLLLTHY